MASPELEWLEADGLGGFASGTVGGYRTRRYHALLLPATTPPTGRLVLVNGFEAWLDLASGTVPLSTQRYGPDVVYPRGLDSLVDFRSEPWPQWTFRCADGTTVRHEVFVASGEGSVVLAWRRVAGAGRAFLHVRPLVSGRDYHALMHENAAFDFNARRERGNASWRPYAGLPAITALSSGTYTHDPVWYRNFLYTQEAARGLDCAEDLGSPGVFTFDLETGDAVWVLRTGDDIGRDAVAEAARIRHGETARRAALAPIERAADAFVVRRGDGHTIIAGYPWFTDWGRDTFIAMRGLVLARGRLDLAASILTAWAGTVSHGMLPNRFPDGEEEPQYNSVDASLWFVIVAREFIEKAKPGSTVRFVLEQVCTAILDGYTRGTRYGIRMDADGLLACGEPGVQLTWMDARVGERVITPRTGKPVEVQALWINALRAMPGRWQAQAEIATTAFRARFHNAAMGCLYDVVDVDHVHGLVDGAFRPNQILAVGGLPFPLLDRNASRQVVDAVETALMTELGPRTLAASDASYRGRYEGGVEQRDGAYHQGTVWPWLAGAFVEAWLRVHGDDPPHRAQARARFVAPLEQRLHVYGLGHLCEIADGDPPHTPRGCPFQAWSLGELIRARLATDAGGT
ncbi:MAG: glycogen debranching enzyme family protein [Burkholderiales bacterium]|nr:glycogen debranching enzyme family protein [Burkholderiales bacterium]